jgi:hypothetical protein
MYIGKISAGELLAFARFRSWENVLLNQNVMSKLQPRPSYNSLITFAYFPRCPNQPAAYTNNNSQQQHGMNYVQLVVSYMGILRELTLSSAIGKHRLKISKIK